MSIFYVLLVLCIIGYLLWLANVYLPMQPVIKNIINFIVILFMIVWLLQAFGLMAGVGNLGIHLH